MFDEKGRLIPIKDRIKTVTVEKKVKPNIVEEYKKARKKPYCKKGKNFKAKGDFKAVITVITQPNQSYTEWLVDYYEYGKLEEKVRFTNQTELFRYLWEVGGHDFINNDMTDVNYDNVFFVKR